MTVFNVRQQRGITLVELMITIVVLAIASSVALPNFQRFVTNQQLDAAARNIQSGLMLVRSEAIKRNSSVFMTQNTDWNDGYIITTNSARTMAQCLANATADCVQVFDPPSASFSVDVSVAGTTQLTFLKNGRHSLAGFSFTVCPIPVGTDFPQRVITIGTTGLPAITHVGECV